MRFLTKLIGALATGILIAGSTAAAMPATRHVIVAVWDDPVFLPALAEAPNVHYEPGAEAQARLLASILPRALATIEAVQGRPFAHPVTLGVYRSPDAYASANGSGSPGPAGVTLFGRLALSPALFDSDSHRLESVLTHELSHAHLQGWMSFLANARLPPWFKEGLAVMASAGGGAEGVTDEEAREALAHGDRIALPEQGSILNLSGVAFQDASAGPQTVARGRMAYRQAALFVSYMRQSNPTAFAALMQDVLDKEPLVDAVRFRYGQTVADLWGAFSAQRGATPHQSN